MSTHLPLAARTGHKREIQLATIEKLLDDDRTDRSDRNYLEELRSSLNHFIETPLSAHQRKDLAAISARVAALPPIDRSSGDLLAGLHRPLKPPMARTG